MFMSVQPVEPTARRWGGNMACVEIGGQSALVLASAEECDKLITAAVEAKRLLLEPAPGECPLCGVIGSHRGDCVIAPEPEPERVPWPVGFCGHPVTPGAWSQGYSMCRDCLSIEQLPLYDRATAGEQLGQVKA